MHQVAVNASQMIVFFHQSGPNSYLLNNIDFQSRKVNSFIYSDLDPLTTSIQRHPVQLPLKALIKRK